MAATFFPHLHFERTANLGWGVQLSGRALPGFEDQHCKNKTKQHPQNNNNRKKYSKKFCLGFGDSRLTSTYLSG
jgi:hypothetical protein